MQNPDATYVAGFARWKQLGRFVRKGEKGLMILAPLVYRTKPKDEAEASDDTKLKVRGFRATFVFDVAQTEGDEIPEFSRLSGDPGAALEKLHSLVRTYDLGQMYAVGLYNEFGGYKTCTLAILQAQLMKPLLQLAVSLHYLCICAYAFSAPLKYNIIDLGVAGRSSSAAVVNDQGGAVFFTHPKAIPSGGPEPGIAYLYDGNIATQLPGTSSLDSASIDMNNDGVVVGHSIDLANNTTWAAKYESGQLTPLALGSNSASYATGINDAGQIVGALIVNGLTDAYLYGNAGAITHIESLYGNGGIAYDINESGEVVGASNKAIDSQSSSSVASTEAFIWKSGTATGLGTLDGLGSEAFAINDNGSVVGLIRAADGSVSAFQYEAALGMRSIAFPGIESWATDINNSRVIVGVALTETHEPRAVVFDSEFGARLLQDLVPSELGWSSLSYANSINASGQILGSGTINGESHVFLATPVPEPSTFTLLLASIWATILARKEARRFPS